MNIADSINNNFYGFETFKTGNALTGGMTYGANLYIKSDIPRVIGISSRCYTPGGALYWAVKDASYNNESLRSIVKEYEDNIQ